MAFLRQIDEKFFRIMTRWSRFPLATGSLYDGLRRERASAVATETIGHHRQERVLTGSPKNFHPILVFLTLSNVRKLVCRHHKTHQYVAI